MKNLDEQLFSACKPMEFARLRIDRAYKTHQLTKREYVLSLQNIGCVPNSAFMATVEKSRVKK